MATKIRCNECKHKKIDGGKMPCNQCSEIQVKRYGKCNYFTPENQNEEKIS